MTRRVEPAGRHVKQLAAIESPSSICSNILIAFMDMRADAQRGQKSALWVPTLLPYRPTQRATGQHSSLAFKY
jgi:hypothetical protein